MNFIVPIVIFLIGTGTKPNPTVVAQQQPLGFRVFKVVFSGLRVFGGEWGVFALVFEGVRLAQNALLPLYNKKMRNAHIEY